MFEGHRKRLRAAAASLLATAACVACVPAAQAQENPERKVRIIEGPAPYPAPESPSSLRGRTRQPNTVVPVAPVPSAEAEDGAFEDLVRNALDEEKKRYPGPSTGARRPSAWPPSDSPRTDSPQADPVPAPAVQTAPTTAPAPPTAEEPTPVLEPPAPKPVPAPGARRQVVREAPPAPTVDVPEPVPPRPYTPPSTTVRTPPKERGTGPVRERIRGPEEPSLREGPVKSDPREPLEAPGGPSESTEGAAMSGIILSDVTIRSEPNKSSAAIGTARAGTTVEVVECVGWCEIRSGGVRGWIYGTFIDLPDATTPGGR